MKRYFHGGIPGLKIGDELLPANAIGDKPSLTTLVPGKARTDRVYLTTDRFCAEAYAAMYPGGGAIYLAEPIGPTAGDPDAPTLSIMSESARVVGIWDSKVRFNPEKALAILGRWQKEPR